MDEYLREALEVVRIQAGVRIMTEDEIVGMVRRVASGLRSVADAMESGIAHMESPDVEPDKAVRETSIVCLECGGSFRTLTKRHLANCGVTPDEYRRKWNYPPDMPLVCKGLQRQRRQKMQEMRLWERRVKN